MLTPEQINNLNEGDPIVIHTTFMRVDEDDDIHFKAPAFNAGYHEGFISRDYVSLPSDSQSEHDPCRLFRKGDIVRLKEWNGRCPALPDGWKFDDGLFKVHVDEKFSSSVAITRENSKDIYLAPICFLELVSPVEELEPYSVEESCGGANLHCFILKRGEKHLSYYLYRSGNANHFYTREEALAAAHAECDRLNAEYRKEHSND